MANFNNQAKRKRGSRSKTSAPRRTESARSVRLRHAE